MKGKVRLDRGIITVELMGHYLVGGMGRMSRSISRMVKLPGCEYAADTLGGGKYGIWAGFHFDPPVKLMVARDRDGTASVMGQGMNGNAAKRLVKLAAYESGLVIELPDYHFVCSMADALIRPETLHPTKDAPEYFRQHLERRFGAQQYARFLSLYKNVPLSESMRKATERFGAVLQDTETN